MFCLAFMPIAIESIDHDYYNITKNVPLYLPQISGGNLLLSNGLLFPRYTAYFFPFTAVLP